MSNLAASVRWVALAQAVRISSQLVSMVVLARLLPPAAYGLMAMAMTVTNFAFLFRDLGTMVAIIQRRTLSDELVCTLYWLNLGLAVVLGLLLLGAALPLAAAYHEPRLAPMIAVLALVFPLSGAAAVQQALLERQANFRRLARIEVVSAVAALALALLLASRGAGVWSLVWQMLLATSLTTAQSFRAVPWRPRKIFVWPALRDILGFSGHFSLFQFVNYIERNADSVIIGAALGSAQLGIYSMASKVMLFPLQNITGVASRALLPAMSRRQDSRPALATLYLRASRTIALISAPLMAGLFALREPFVALLLGPHWLAMAALLKWLAVAGFIQSITASTGAVFLALGKSRLMLLLGVFGAGLQLSAFLIGVHWGLEGVAASFCVANLFNALPGIGLVIYLLGIEPGAILRDIGKPVLAAAAMLLVLQLCVPTLTALAPSASHAFVLNIGVGVLSYAFTLLVLLRQDLSDMRALLRFESIKP